MAPRKPKVDDDAASTTSTDLPAVLKPKTDKAKVEKPKSDKPKVARPKAPKKEKVVVEGEKPEKDKVKKEPAVARDGKDAGAGGKADIGGGKDGKQKVKPVTGDEAVEIIAQYLREQNRPYSATEVSLNLHGKVTKTVADKLLKEMEQNGLIKGKASKSGTGGQWVFWTTQNPADAASPEELATMTATMSTLRETNPNLKATLKTLTTKLANLRSAPTTVDLAAAVERMREENKEKGERVKAFQEGTVRSVTTEEVERVEKDLKYWGAKRVIRKKIYDDLEGMLLDGMGMPREELREQAGVEEDVY